MTMVRPNLPPLPPPLPSPYRDLSTPTPGYDPKTMAPQPLPRQYAFPLSRHSSYHSQGSGSEHDRGRKPPEHLLRRKTPNGVLAAAYDGTSVEETEKPHATKHILLPVTADSGIPYGMRQDLPLRLPTDTGYLQQGQPSDWSPSQYFATGSGRGHDAWKGSGQPMPQIDSMLHQMPPLQPPPQYPIYGQPYMAFCAAMEPSFQPMGPTASNDQGPYGPYWHDGTFIPYQAAALRDPRFISHHGPDWNAQQPGTWHNYNNTPVANQPQQTPYPIHPPLNTYNNIGKPSLDYALPYPYSHQRNLSTDYHGQMHATPTAQRPAYDLGISSSGQTTPVQGNMPGPNPLADFGPQSLNAQTRERVFAWAHTVYIDLLKYLQATRKPNPNARQANGVVRAHIYPKPPRQPGATFTKSSRKGGSPQTSERPSSLSATPSYGSHEIQGMAQSNQAPSYPTPDTNYQRAASGYSLRSSSRDDNNRQHWQQAQYGTPHEQAFEPQRSLRRMSGTSITGVNHNYRQEQPPSMTAAAALDAIANHCGDSKWAWIDGILLGGCLAYALGDYQKAQSWYEHILTLDQK